MLCTRPAWHDIFFRVIKRCTITLDVILKCESELISNSSEVYFEEVNIGAFKRASSILI